MFGCSGEMLFCLLGLVFLFDCFIISGIQNIVEWSGV